MFISESKSLVGVSIPKTGSRSIREAFSSAGLISLSGSPDPSDPLYQHSTAHHILLQMNNAGLNTENYNVCCVVRNPWERYFSFYKYSKEYICKYKNKVDHVNWDEAALRQGEFLSDLYEGRKLVNNDLSTDQRFLKAMILGNQPQSNFIFNERGENLISHILKQETLQENFNSLCDEFNIPRIELKTSNRSGMNWDISEIYSQELINIVSEKEKEVIKLFNYDLTFPVSKNSFVNVSSASEATESINFSSINWGITI